MVANGYEGNRAIVLLNECFTSNLILEVSFYKLQKLLKQGRIIQTALD